MGDIDLRNELDKIPNIKSGNDSHDETYNIISNRLSNDVLNYDKQYSQELLHFAGGYPDWTHSAHHAGFDIVANRIYEVLNNYYAEFNNSFNDEIEILDNNTIETVVTANSKRKDDNTFTDCGICFWVTGHSMGAGVANLLSADLIDKGYEDNVYCYTFASPNTFYMTDNNSNNYREPHGSRYRCIFNIVNDDDFVPKLPMEECEWTKYGRVAKLSIKEDLYNRFVSTVNLYDYQTAHYSNPIINPSDARYSFDMTKIPYMKYVTETYKTEPWMINTIVDSFNNMFSDKNNMRSDAYKYVDSIVEYAPNDKTLDAGLGFYSKVYQKYEVNKGEIKTRTSKSNNSYVSTPFSLKIQRQMPAYIMMSVANAMHTNWTYFDKNDLDENGNPKMKMRKQQTDLDRSVGPFHVKITENEAVLFDAKFATFNMFLSKWSMLIGEGMFKAIDYPHYLESYYTLSKEITTTDFR